MICIVTGQSDPSVPRRDNPPLFINDNKPAQPALETIESISESESIQARPFYKNSQTRQALEGYRSPYIKNKISTKGAYSLEPGNHIKSPDNDTIASKNKLLGLVKEDEPNTSSTNSLFNRQELKSSRSDISYKSNHLARESDLPSTPNESASAHESLESASQIAARDYSPSVDEEKRQH